LYHTYKKNSKSQFIFLWLANHPNISNFFWLSSLAEYYLGAFYQTAQSQLNFLQPKVIKISAVATERKFLYYH